MKKYIFIALAAIAALSSCAKESLVSNDENGKEAQVFTATMEDGITTKVTFDATNKCAFWEINDEVSINGKKYKAQSAGTTTTFAAIDGGAEGPTYNAYFPAGLYDGTNAILPANVSETWADSKFNMPMYAESSTFDLSFKNLCGVLKIIVTNAQLTSVKSITVSSTNCATSGAFTVSGDAAVLTDPSKTANTVTVTYTDAVVTDATGKVFYVAIPAQTYKNLSIAVSDGTTTKVKTTKADQDITVARKTVYPIAFDSFGEADVKADAGISGNKVKWVQLWENGPKFAEYNVGVTDGKAESYGGYYAWGGSQDKVDDHNTGTGDLSPTSDPITDTATNLWGSNWRMPTRTELQGLIDNCTVETVYDPSDDTKFLGKKFTGKGAYASNSVFLPAAGYSNGTVTGQGNGGFYWSSAPNGSDKAFSLQFLKGSLNMYDKRNRSYGCSVRAVLAE